jgi:putative hemolysin
MEILILLALILLNGVFAMSEIALVTARKARLQKMIDEGDSAAAAALKLGEDPTRFLSTIQIGITSIGVLSGIVGESALADPLALWLHGVGMDHGLASILSTALVVVVITYLSIVIGELVICWPCRPSRSCCSCPGPLRSCSGSLACVTRRPRA